MRPTSAFLTRYVYSRRHLPQCMGDVRRVVDSRPSARLLPGALLELYWGVNARKGAAR